MEAGLSLQLQPIRPAGAGGVAAVVAPEDAARLLALLRALPHGPLRFSAAVPGLVATSSNVASVKPLPAEPAAAADASGAPVRAKVAFRGCGDYSGWWAVLSRPRSARSADAAFAHS